MTIDRSRSDAGQADGDAPDRFFRGIVVAVLLSAPLWAAIGLVVSRLG